MSQGDAARFCVPTLDRRILTDVVQHMQVGLHLYCLEDPDDDRTLRMIATNPAAAAFTGVPMKDVLGKTLDENFPGLREKGIPQLYAEVVRTGTPRTLEDVYYGDDRVIHGAFAVKAFPLPGHCVGVVFENITERKQAEAQIQQARKDLEQRVQERTRELRLSEEKYRHLFLTMVQGVVYQDAEGRITSANPAAERILGLDLDQMMGRTSVDPGWRTIHEDGSEFSGQDHPSMVALRTGEPVVDVVMGVMHPGQQEYRWILVDAVPKFREGEERPCEVFASFTDITERKRADEERQQLEKKILQAQKLESLGVLAGGIAHDFNNLLMGLLGNAEMALLELTPESPARQCLKDIQIASIRLAELTRQMLAYSGKGKFVVEPLNLSRMVEEMAHLLNASIPKKVVLKFDLESSLPAIRADASQVRQVIMNLITNAAEACGDRSGIVSLRTGVVYADPKYLSENYLAEDLREGYYVFFEVSDTGSGMDEETRGKIFDPFFSTKFTGRGLGLAAVLGIVRGHGAAIKVYSEPQRGSTFKVLFPTDERPAVDRTETGPPAASWTGRGIILQVDDEETVLATGRRMLSHLGFEVLAARNGEEAVELARARLAELSAVLLDLTMPRMDGLQAFDQIRRIRPELPVILCSGYNQQEATSHFTGKGLAGFLQKPYRLQQLAAKLREILEPRAG